MREIIQKMVWLGDASTDKWALLKPLVYSMFDDKYRTTIGTKVTKKTVTVEVEVGGAKVPIRDTLLIWDILGQKQYTKLHPVYYQGAEGALVVCHAQRPATIVSVGEWIRGLQEVVGPVPLALLVNCGSLAAIEGADVEALRVQAGARDLPIFLTSPETWQRTEEALLHCARVMAQARAERKGLAADGEGGLAVARRRWWFRRPRG